MKYTRCSFVARENRNASREGSFDCKRCYVCKFFGRAAYPGIVGTLCIVLELCGGSAFFALHIQVDVERFHVDEEQFSIRYVRRNKESAQIRTFRYTVMECWI